MGEETTGTLRQSKGGVKSPIPLSFQQKFHWYNLRRFRYFNLNIAFALRLSGVLNVELLGKSFAAVIRRHSILRTRIALIDGVPRQMIESSDDFHLDVVALSGASAIEMADVQRSVEEFLNRPFDLTRGALFRSKLMRLTATDHIFLVSVHHLIFDGASVGILSNEIWQSYAALSRDRPPELAPLRIQYSDYAFWQQETADDWSKNHEPYWQKRLAGVLPLRLPIDHSAADGSLPQDQTGRGMVEIQLGETFAAEMRAVAQRQGTMSAMIMLTAFVAAVSRWSNQRDFIVPVVFSGRDDPDHAYMLGSFAQWLMLRMELAGREEFSDLLDKVTREFFVACEHHDDERAATQIAADTSDAERTKLFSTQFNWISMSLAELAGRPHPAILDQLRDELAIEPFPFRQTAKYPNAVDGPDPIGFSDVPGIVLSVMPEKSITANLYYNAQFFLPHTIETLVKDLRSILEGFIANPQSYMVSAERAAAGTII